MTNAFTDAADGAPFIHLETKIPFYEMNPDGAPMQAESNGWDFSKEDAAPDIALNEAIWKSVRGADAEMPAPVNAAVRAGSSRRAATDGYRTRSRGPSTPSVSGRRTCTSRFLMTSV